MIWLTVVVTVLLFAYLLAALVRGEVARRIEQQSFPPLGGRAGEPLVNVLELNLALDERFPVPPPPGGP